MSLTTEEVNDIVESTLQRLESYEVRIQHLMEEVATLRKDKALLQKNYEGALELIQEWKQMYHQLLNDQQRAEQDQIIHELDLQKVMRNEP